MFGKKREKQNFDGLTIYTAFQHVDGLPIAENTLCEIFSYPDRYEFKAGTTSIRILKEKITDICITTDTDIQKQYVSSVGGAVGGAVLFGPIGAIIGGRAKQKKIKTVTNYLIITYKKDENLKYLAFDTEHNPPSAVKLVNEFKKNSTVQGIQIEL